MNDFTKDELYTLLKCVRLAAIAHGEHPDLDNAEFKLRVMIDNYCEHVWAEGGGTQVHCGKCGAWR
jgi:hypothetical protein